MLHIPAEANFRAPPVGSGGSGEAVAEYRAYRIGSDGHFYDAVALVCADDAEAIEQAKKLVADHDVELWQLDRKVGTLTKVKKSTP